MGSKTPPGINVYEHSSLCHPQMQVKAQSCKEETILYVNMIQKCCRLLWAWAHLKWSESNWKTDSDHFQFWRIKIVNYFWKPWTQCSPEWRGTIWLVISAQFNSLHLWWYGDPLVPMEWATCTLVLQDRARNCVGLLSLRIYVCFLFVCINFMFYKSSGVLTSDLWPFYTAKSLICGCGYHANLSLQGPCWLFQAHWARASPDQT